MVPHQRASSLVPMSPFLHVPMSPFPHVPCPTSPCPCVPPPNIPVPQHPHVLMLPMSLSSPVAIPQCPTILCPHLPVSNVFPSPTCPRCPLLQDICAVCQQLFDFLRQASNQSTVEKPWQVCVTLKLCRTKPGAAPTVPVLEAPGSHLQGSGGAGLSPKALPLPLPLCWLCRTLVARAEAAVPVSSVATAVAGLCRALPLPVAGACQCLAERYAALALEGLLGRLGPRLLCRLFLACRGGDNWDNEDVGTLPPPWVLEAIVVRLAECVSEEDPQGLRVPALSLPLGPCALGPIFWCSGPKAAQRCQALQHCQEHVWL
uniref:Uncharacterized protein n=1 Tax=Cyanoderma ruficeps TaxID=181631 RepID=A0A8C3QSY1_9PASS